jgi:dynein heavy chain
LRKEGVDYSRYSVEQDHDSGKPSYLPLEIFDDTEYEGRRPSEWIALGTDPDVPIGTPGSCAIEARALRIEVDDHARFVPCEVIGWDEEQRKFIVRWRTGGGPETDGRWKDINAEARCYPVHVCFQADNPFVFAKRVANAHAARREFEANIRYALYVDSMPTDEIAPLDTEQVNRILQLALNTKKLKQNALDTTSLLNEVNIDYARTMNKIIFDVNLKDPAQAPLRQSLKLATIGTDVVVHNGMRESPYLGVVPVPFHDFPKHFSDFCFHSFYTKLEAINALVKVNGECLKLQKSNIFHTNITKVFFTLEVMRVR